MNGFFVPLKYFLNSSLVVKNIGDFISLNFTPLFLNKVFILFSKKISSISKKTYFGNLFFFNYFFKFFFIGKFKIIVAVTIDNF